MNIERIGNDRTGAGGQPLPFSPAVRAGDFVYVSGQIAMNERGEVEPGGIEEQTRRTLENVQNVLKQAGCTLDEVVKANCWLDDPRDFWTFNKVYAEFFPNGGPARSTVRFAIDGGCKSRDRCDRIQTARLMLDQWCVAPHKF